MFPYLLNISFIRIPSFTVFATIAILVAIFIIWRQAKEKLYSEDALFDTILLSLVGGYLFGRIGYAALHFDIFGTSLLRWIAFWVFPGFYLYSGIVGSLFVLWYQSKQNKELKFWELLDMFGFALWVGLIIAFFGVFLGGLEQGMPSSVYSVAHPVTLYKLVMLLIFMIPYLVFRYEKGREDWFHKTSGSVGLSFLALFSFGTIVLDLFKQRVSYYGFSVDQWISLIILVGSLTFLYVRLKRTPRKDLQSLARVYHSVKNGLFNRTDSKRRRRKK